MTYQEAIENLEGCNGSEEWKEIFYLAIEALKRMEKKKPLKIFNLCEGTVKCGFCENCNHQVVEGMNFCSACGQALDWSDVE